MTDLFFLFLHQEVREFERLSMGPPPHPQTRLEASLGRTTLSCLPLVQAEGYHNQRPQLPAPYDNPGQAEMPVSGRVCGCVY